MVCTLGSQAREGGGGVMKGQGFYLLMCIKG